ncbi:MAG TPA: 2Fe-2S iron-sulfur cluster-binding protein, partial [Polyangiaceae bacterium]|nr:2Fe-2S iron-sulfur cluster-binding protein [Polyangiaceae bacterium]
DCFDGSCGGCTMLIQGKVGLACSLAIGKVADKDRRVRLGPMRRFPLVRDLVVDRSRIQRTLGLVPLQGPRSPSVSVKQESASATLALELARLDQCHRCGACLEACPQYGVHSEFVGALTLHEAHLRNSTPSARHQRTERLEAMMAPGGVNSCGKAQNCVEVCPADLPLVDSIQSVARATTKHMLLGWLSK